MNDASNIRKWIDNILHEEHLPMIGDGIFLEFDDRLEVATEILDINEDEIVVLGDHKLLEFIDLYEKWSAKYKRSINCNRPKGFSQRAHCAGRRKEESVAEDLHEFLDTDGNGGGEDGFSEETLKHLAAQWYNGDEDPKVARILMAAGWEIGQDEGYDDEPGVFVVQSGDVNGNSYISWPAHELKQDMDEAEYHGRKVPLGKPMQGDVKKFKVYVKDPKTGNIKKVNFGDKSMRIKKSNPKRRKSFRARHHCDNPGPRTKARYWSCRKW